MLRKFIVSVSCSPSRQLKLIRKTLLSTKTDSFLSGSSSLYVEQMYDLWKQDPKSVHSSWQSYFNNLDSGVDPSQAFIAPPSIAGSIGSKTSAATSAKQPSGALVSDSLALSYLIHAYQVRGHEMANLDPLGIHSFRSDTPPELDYKFHGFKDEDLDRQLNLLGNHQVVMLVS